MTNHRSNIHQLYLTASETQVRKKQPASKSGCNRIGATRHLRGHKKANGAPTRKAYLERAAQTPVNKKNPMSC